MRIPILMGLFLCSIGSLTAQEVLWQKDIKSSTQDFLCKISTTIDGQYLVGGSTIQPLKLTSAVASGGKAQSNGYDFHLVKLNQQGEKVWEKYYGGESHDFLNALAATQEGGFLISGSSYSRMGVDKKDQAIGGSDIWLLKLDENGKEEWQKTIGTANDDEAGAVIQTMDLGFVVAGTTQNTKDGYGSKDIYVVRLDKNGNEVSRIILGGQGLDEVSKMTATRDGGFILGMYSRSGVMVENKTVSPKKNITSKDNKNNSTKELYLTKTTENYGEGDFWIMKFNKDGKMQWQKSFGGSEDDRLKTLNVSDKGYIVAGESRSKKSGNKTTDLKEGTDLWIMSLNDNGEENWQKSYSFKNRDVLMSNDVIFSADDTVAKGMLLGGYTQAEGRMEKDDETFWMLYLDMNGEEKWRKHVKGESRKKEERLVDLAMNRDGSIILAGTSASELGKEDWKIVKLGDKNVKDEIEKLDIKIYPNPVSEYCYVEIGYEFKDATIDLYDLSGKHLQSTATKNRVTKINTADLIQGVYVITVKTNTNKTANAKIIKK